jgi:CYTH domain-containing protein
MTITRRFLVAPALARLIRRERGSVRIAEGHFPSQTERASFIQVEDGMCHLVLVTSGPDGTVEERADVPRAHADALLDVCAGKLAYDRVSLPLGDDEALLDRFSGAGILDLASVAFETQDAAAAFLAPVWFGDEVTDDAAYSNQALAVSGLPAPREVYLSNGALDAVIDLLDSRGAQRVAAPRRDAMESLRRAVGPRPAAGPGAVGAEAVAPQRARVGLTLATAPDSRREAGEALPAFAGPRPLAEGER